MRPSAPVPRLASSRACFRIQCFHILVVLCTPFPIRQAIELLDELLASDKQNGKYLCGRQTRKPGHGELQKYMIRPRTWQVRARPRLCTGGRRPAGVGARARRLLKLPRARRGGGIAWHAIASCHAITASRRIASHRVASRRIASHRVASQHTRCAGELWRRGSGRFDHGQRLLRARPLLHTPPFTRIHSAIHHTPTRAFHV
jgi:hypothetical protein